MAFIGIDNATFRKKKISVLYPYFSNDLKWNILCLNEFEMGIFIYLKSITYYLKVRAITSEKQKYVNEITFNTP